MQTFSMGINHVVSHWDLCLNQSGTYAEKLRNCPLFLVGSNIAEQPVYNYTKRQK
jgi:hypothetical protein